MITNITNENFAAAWNYLERKRCWSKKFYISRYAADFVSQIIFFLCFMGFSFSLLNAYGGKYVADFLGKFPAAMAKWETVAQYFRIENPTWQFALLTLLKVYCVCIVSAVSFAAIVLLLYWPRKKALPSHPSVYQDAAFVSYREFSRYHKHLSSNIRGFCGALYGVSALAFVTGFLMHCAQMRKYQFFFEQNAPRINLVACCGALLLIVFYFLLTYPLDMVIHCGLRNYIPQRFRQALELYHIGSHSE